MAEVGLLDFDVWLNVKLKNLNTDEGVFGSYIKGILEDDDSTEDKTEALEGILSEIIDSDDISGHCREILDRWQTALNARAAERVAPAGPAEMGAALARLMETQAVPAQAQRARQTDEERKIREAILAQYSQMSDEEEEEAGGGGGGGGGGGAAADGAGLERNTNAAVVAQAERDKREQAKVNSRQKKDKDREDREKQKAQAAEKKEKRKTQKGERRR